MGAILRGGGLVGGDLVGGDRGAASGNFRTRSLHGSYIRILRPAYAVAGYVGASRLNANKHYLSDVAFGAALGIVAGRTVTVGIGSTKFALQPIAAQGGVGIGFTLIPKK